LSSYDNGGTLPRFLQGQEDRHGGNSVGTVLMIMASLLNGLMMSSVKELSDIYPIWQILLIRSIGQFTMLIPIIISSRGQVFKTEQLGLQIVRAMLSFIALLAWFYAIANLPLAEASAISFLRILFVVALAGIIFGDKIGIVGWSASLLGLSGIMIMLDPSAEGLNGAALVGAGGALITAVVTIIIKRLTQTDKTSTIMCYSCIGLALMSAIPSGFSWQPIDLDATPIFALLILSAFTTQWCFTNAYRHGETSVIATVEYLRLVSAALLGFLIFSEIPTLGAIFGIFLIVAASFIAIKREKIRRRLKL
jgi:drug/metabolite transporter (DMT)-like permease